MKQKKEATLRARVSSKYAERVSKEAEKLGLSLSDFVRIAINEKLENMGSKS